MRPAAARRLPAWLRAAAPVKVAGAVVLGPAGVETVPLLDGAGALPLGTGAEVVNVTPDGV